MLWYSLLRSEERWEQNNRIHTLEEHQALLYSHLGLRVKFIPAHKEVVERLDGGTGIYDRQTGEERNFITIPKSTKKRA